MIKVYSFDYGLSALSFAKFGDDFYIGLGCDGVYSDDAGRVLKIEIFKNDSSIS